ncbi:flagellar motor switch protein FliM [Planococcus lenghuensis]|uniref:Flagellar motor switch protein FliM n=1 Tax=Planococcus lenghuensis TaxID=2213202 RepID=A0A1Q2L173_9BACL|nr:flagellar motor switch protein FliM [Planococcus lenghuensis]AQQ54124.1 flagellar motor switch protein FliM [Planococcus lenghuensis]
MNTLSDDQLNAILSSLQQEESAKHADSRKRSVHTYDFKKALRFSQDQIRTLTRIHENFARLLTSYFSAQLRTMVQVTVDSVEQCPYEEFIQNVQKRSILGVFEAKPLQGSMVMELSPDLAYVTFDRLLGGQGKVLQKHNDLTEIEISLIERVFVKAIDSFQEAWSSVIRLAPELKEIEVNPQFLTMSPPNETVILVELNVKIGEVEGVINICLPHVVLEQVLPKLSARHWLANQKKAVEDREVEAIEQKLQGTKFDVKAVLGRSTINISDFLSLKNGDIIRLNEAYDDPVTVWVDEKQKFFGQPGVAKGRMVVQITEVRSEGDEYDDK